MALNVDEATKRVVDKLDRLGMDSMVDGNPSHTANLVKEIVKSIIQEIKQNGQVIVRTDVLTNGSPSTHTGHGVGKGYII